MSEFERSHLKNIIFKMNQRFQGTLVNDPDLMISVSLTNVLILNVKIFE